MLNTTYRIICRACSRTYGGSTDTCSNSINHFPTAEEIEAEIDRLDKEGWDVSYAWVDTIYRKVK